MNGETTKFYSYETTSGRINIPKKVARVLDWNHEDEIGMIIEVVNGKKGLFLFKRET